jgi:phenylacetate-CoA ligase
MTNLLASTGDHEADCAATLEQALTLTPFYKRWRAFDPGQLAPVDQRFAALPVSTKRDLRLHIPEGLVPCDRDWKGAITAGEVELVSTSGTTAERATVVWFQPWWDAAEQSAAGLHTGLAEVIQAAPREAVLTTPLCAGNLCHVGDLTMAERTLGRLLFLNQKPDPNHWTPVDMDRMIDELGRFRPDILEADPAYLAILSRHAAAQQASVFQPRFVVLTYELPSRLHRRDIRRVFENTPVVSSYGSTETGHVFLECEHGSLHQNMAFARVDFQPLQRPHGGPTVGRLLVTPLRHPWMSLLRFDVGDLARLAEGPCPCGRREGMTLAAIEGRVRDLTFAADGRAVTPHCLDAALANIEELRAYQVVQESPKRFVFHYVAEPGSDERVAKGGIQSLQELYGREVEIHEQRETAIMVEQSGKFRLAQTRFSWDPETLLEREERAVCTIC